MSHMPRVRVQFQYDEGVSLRLWIRWVSLGVATMCFLWTGWFRLDQYLHQMYAAEVFESAATDDTTREETDLAHGPLARLEIARLGVSGYVLEGFDADTLRRAIGHSPASARPGEPGNVVLAAHRDTFFSGLRDVRKGDVIDLQARGGRTLHYRVTNVFITDPTDVRVMNPTPGRNLLTLITCYPFQFVGSAPQRLIVQAQPVSQSSASRI